MASFVPAPSSKIVFAGNATWSGGVTTYCPINGGTPTATQANANTCSPTSMTLTGLTVVNVQGASGAGSSVFTLFKNGVATALTVSIPAASPQNTATSVTGTVSVTTGDRLTLENAANANGGIYAWGIVGNA